MSIRNKIFLVLIPLLLVGLIITGAISAIATRSGLVQTGVKTMSLKSSQLEQNINESWTLLKDNNIELTDQYKSTFTKDIISFAATMIQSDSESIFLLDENNKQLASTSAEDINEQEANELINLIKEIQKSNKENNENRHWISQGFQVAGEDRIGYFFVFEPLNWTILISDKSDAFFAPVTQIIIITIIVILTTIIITLLVIVLFTNTLVQPISQLVKSMQNIIKTNNFSERVDIFYNDEVGGLSNTFNIMVEELEGAYKQIKQYAFRAMFAKRQENKIRNIFQKYVPNSVINSLFKNPTQMLGGENKNLAIMFTDIRSFTTISESFKPDELVTQLNHYFEKLVGIITEHEGIVDKYIGDAIMAFFGAPNELENSSLAAIKAAVIMEKALNEMNDDLIKRNKPPFITGIGVNFGEVTVGNIGSEKKMDYTVIGDAVNLGSRLEGLTKQYKTNLIFSESVCDMVRNIIPCRIVDAVQVKGKTVGQKIFTSTAVFTPQLLDAYALHNQATQLYFEQQFQDAIELFKEVLALIPEDTLSLMYIERCEAFIKNPPPKDWDGVFVMSTK